MARKSKRPAKRRAVPPRASRRPAARRAPTKTQRRDPFDEFIVAAARALDLPAERKWLPAIKANLQVTLQHAAAVAEFQLPDGAEPAPVFKA